MSTTLQVSEPCSQEGLMILADGEARILEDEVKCEVDSMSNSAEDIALNLHAQSWILTLETLHG